MANPRGNPEFGKSIVGQKRERKPAPVVAPRTSAEAFALVDEFVAEHILEYIQVLHKRATKNDDKQAAMYLADRLLGKPSDRTGERDDLYVNTIERLAESVQQNLRDRAELGVPSDLVQPGGLQPERGADPALDAEGPSE